MAMDVLKMITEKFVNRSRELLGDILAGIYLHGSAAMGCFNPAKSDIDLLVVIHRGMTEEEKLLYMDMVVELNALAPAKGIEMSIVRKAVCRPFVYPTPFELHFSVAHLNWYRSNPRDYVRKMNGTDKDLAAHVMVTLHRGQCLYGEEIEAMFESVGREIYWDSIWYDVAGAEADISENPVYVTLNLCRALAYRRENRILSKEEGGRWCLEHLQEMYGSLIRKALAAYSSAGEMEVLPEEAAEYAGFMLAKLKE